MNKMHGRERRQDVLSWMIVDLQAKADKHRRLANRPGLWEPDKAYLAVAADYEMLAAALLKLMSSDEL